MTEQSDACLLRRINTIARQLKMRRQKFALTQAEVAKKIGIKQSYYAKMEDGKTLLSPKQVNYMLDAARSMGIQQLKYSYINELRRHIMLDLKNKEMFFHSHIYSVQELKEQGVFISPHKIFALADKIDLSLKLSRGDKVDLVLLELWVAAHFAFVIKKNKDQKLYLRPVREEYPDAEILNLNKGEMKLLKVEVTHYSRYSKDIYDVLKKKLGKRYDENTFTVVFVSRKDTLNLNDLNRFIKQHNSNNQKIWILGYFKKYEMILMPCSEITPEGEGASWAELVLNQSNIKKKHSKYDGVIVYPPYDNKIQFLKPAIPPCFIKKIHFRSDTFVS